MIAVVQRTGKASVEIDSKVTAAIESGMVILLGVNHDDEYADADYLAKKLADLRFFEDTEGKMNLSIRDISGSVLIISQFTLCADCRKGRRPSFNNAADPGKGKQLYEYFVNKFRELNIPVQTGNFGAMMDVNLINRGPVTFVLDSNLKSKK